MTKPPMRCGIRYLPCDLSLSVDACFLLSCSMTALFDLFIFIYCFHSISFESSADMQAFPLLAEFSRFLGSFLPSHTGFMKFCFCQIIQNSTFLVTKWSCFKLKMCQYVFGWGFTIITLTQFGESLRCSPDSLVGWRGDGCSQCPNLPPSSVPQTFGVSDGSLSHFYNLAVGMSAYGIVER